MTPISILVKFLGDSTPLTRATKKAQGDLRGVRRETERFAKDGKQLQASLDKTRVAMERVDKSTDQLNNSRKALKTTTRQLLTQERFIGDAFGANASKINKQYLGSVNGLRTAIGRLGS